MKIRTDGDVIKACRKIERAYREVTSLIMDIEASEHPNAAAIAQALWEECWFASAAPIVVSDHLLKPDAWEFSDRGAVAKHKAATKANAGRRLSRAEKVHRLSQKFSKELNRWREV